MGCNNVPEMDGYSAEVRFKSPELHSLGLATRNHLLLIGSLLCAFHHYHSSAELKMAATLRTLRPLARQAAPAFRGRMALPLLSQRRGYKQPARDMMTGEVIQLPDIDVRYHFA